MFLNHMYLSTMVTIAELKLTLLTEASTHDQMTVRQQTILLHHGN